MRKRTAGLIVAILSIVNTGASLSSAAIYSLTETQGIDKPDESKPIPIRVNESIVDSLKIGQEIAVPLLDGGMVQGKVTTTLVGEGTRGTAMGSSKPAAVAKKNTKTWVVALLEQAGSLEITIENETILRLLLFDAKEVTYHLADINGNGAGDFMLQDANSYQCVDYPVAPDSSATISLANDDGVASATSVIPDVETLTTLQSRPGAENVIFIDYWGGTLSGTHWNDSYTGGNDIIYTPFNSEGDSTTFSGTERFEMWLGWREVAEDYAAFDVNVTTDINVFNSTANAHKIRNIVTDTNYFFPGFGGVANVDSFGRDSAYSLVSWTWNDGALGQTISHEAGHQMGLGHDGTSSDSRYNGHGDWAPIMGAPTDKKYIQFSKGEYQGANQKEDDLAIINGKLSVVLDEAGDDNVSARSITLPVANLEGVISPAGLAADIDIYKFTLSASQMVYLSVAPLLPAHELMKNSVIEYYTQGTNLSIQAFLLDSAGNDLARTDPNGMPAENILAYNGRLDAGTYYFQIKNLSPNPDWSAGFGEYGNGGFYSVSFERESSCGGTFDLPSNQWRQISLPCDPGSNSSAADIL